MPEQISDSDAHYALDIVKTICAEVGPGMPGTPQERERAAVIGRELASHLGAENVACEEFAVAPWAMLSAYPLSAALMLIAALLSICTGRLAGVSPWPTAIGALAISLAAPLPFIFLFILDREWADRLFVQKQSVNVIGTLRRPGTATVRRLLIVSGHHDSAPENTWLGLLGYGFFVASAIWGIGFIAMLALSIIQLAGVIGGDPGRIGMPGWIVLAFLVAPAAIFGLSFNRGKKGGGTVPGAADNLAACAIAVATCRFLVRNPSHIPPDTEIRFITFGSEEAGLRGSRRYVQRHLDELRRLDARVLNYETVAHPEIPILTSDENGTVKNSPVMVASLVAAAERAGVPYTVKPAGIGTGSDAGPFSEAGLKAAALLPFLVPQQLVAFYHQKRDRPEVLTIEPLLNVLKLTFEWVRNDGE